MSKFWFIELLSYRPLRLSLSPSLSLVSLFCSKYRLLFRPSRAFHDAIATCFLLPCANEILGIVRGWSHFKGKETTVPLFAGNLASLAIFSPNYFLANLVILLFFFFVNLSRSNTRQFFYRELETIVRSDLHHETD